MKLRTAYACSGAASPGARDLGDGRERVCCANAERGPSCPRMSVRRLVAALVVLSFALALAFPPGPAQAALSFANMPCHAEAVPMSSGDEVPQTDPSCCLPLCWVALDTPASLSGERLRPVFVLVGRTTFASVGDRPQVPPPKRT